MIKMWNNSISSWILRQSGRVVELSEIDSTTFLWVTPPVSVSLFVGLHILVHCQVSDSTADFSPTIFFKSISYSDNFTRTVQSLW
jgi:hypothetical protein